MLGGFVWMRVPMAERGRVVAVGGCSGERELTFSVISVVGD